MKQYVLNEINMSPGNLQSMASQVQGAIAGIEFELYIPNVVNPADETIDPIYSKKNLAVDRKINTKKVISDLLSFFSGREYPEYATDAMDQYDLEELEIWCKQIGEKSLPNWLAENHIVTMYDMCKQGGYLWPYYIKEYNLKYRTMADIADDFQQNIGRNVKFSYIAKSNTQDGTSYVIEPDRSLRQPNSDDDVGLEIISPPLPLFEMVRDLQKIIIWAKHNDVYTNETTGLHINVSIPSFSIENLDYVKMALLLGDTYILQQFGRVGCWYCASSLKTIQETVISSPDLIITAFDKIKANLDGIASKIIHNGLTEKHVSINTKHGTHVEIRSPGGNWLNAGVNKILATMNRIVVALDAARDPNKYRQEYLTKLYKLMPSEAESPLPTLLAQYQNEELTATELKNKWATYVLNMKKSERLRNTASQQKLIGYKVYSNNDNRYDVIAANAGDAIEIAQLKYPELSVSGVASVQKRT